MREKIEMNTHRKAIMLTTAWPMLLSAVMLFVFLWVTLPVQAAAAFSGVVVVVLGAVYLLCLPNYTGVYRFVPANQYQGPRIVAELGKNKRNTYQIDGVKNEELILKSSWLEKKLGVAHLRVKGTSIYLRGVAEPERVRAWIDANFPVRATEQNKKKKR